MGLSTNDFVMWLNENDGLLTLLLFIISIIFAWTSGIFKNLMNKPKVNISLIQGPNFCCIIDCDELLLEQPTKRTALSLYLKITNVGNTALGIDNIEIHYKTNVLKFENLSLWKRFKHFEYKIERFRFLYKWFPKIEMTMLLSDFLFNFNLENELKHKHYPMLVQKSELRPESHDLYLLPYNSVSGIVYFESLPWNGGYEPKLKDDDMVEVKVILKITANKTFKKTVEIPLDELEEAQKYNKSFGKSFSTLKNTENT